MNYSIIIILINNPRIHIYSLFSFIHCSSSMNKIIISDFFPRVSWNEVKWSEVKSLSSVQFSSVTQSRPTLWDPMNRSTPGLPVHHQLPEFTQTHVHRVGDVIQHLILCRPLLLLPSIPPSIRVFSSESTHRMRWPKYWSFSFSIIPSKEIPGLISFRMDLLDLLAVQGILKSLLQHHSSKASILRRSAFFTMHQQLPELAQTHVHQVGDAIQPSHLFSTQDYINY